MKPSISIIAVSNRPDFAATLLRYNLARQTYTNLQVIFVDSSKDGYRLPEADTYIRKDPSACVGELSNAGLDAVEGKHFTFWDDDDWQHPLKLSKMVEYLEGSAQPSIAWSTGWFFSLAKRLWTSGRIVLPHHIQTLYPAAWKDKARFPLKTPAPDMVYAKQLHKLGDPYLIGDILVHSFWLNHTQNDSGRGDKGMLFPLDLRERIGEYWGDTEAVLDVISAAAALREVS